MKNAAHENQVYQQQKELDNLENEISEEFKNKITLGIKKNMQNF